MHQTAEPSKSRRLYLLLRDRITNGEWEPGAKLTGEPRLAAENGVSRVTLRRALDRLAAEGLLVRRPGAGTYVGEPRVRPAVADLSNLLAQLAEMGRNTSVRLLHFAYADPPAPVARALRLAPGERVQRSVRVRLSDGHPFSHLTAHVPERIGRAYTEADLAATPLLELLERSGAVAERAEQAIGAVLAAPDAAAALGVEVGSPLLSLTRTVFDPADRGVEHLHALYRPDRYALRMDLVRAGVPGGRHWAPARPRRPGARTERNTPR